MTDLKTTLIQSDIIWENRDKNLEHLSHKLETIKDSPDLIVLPEMFATGFTMNVDTCAESENGRIVSWMKMQAKSKKCCIAGSVLIEDNKQFFNRMIWMKPDGTYDTYDKRHLFRMGNEHKTMSAGESRKIVELKGWKINLQICYDLRFPVWSKNNFMEDEYEYDALLYVANWPEIRSHAYQSLLKARAIENQSYVIWVNRVGKDGNHIYHSGDSMIIDPYGKIIFQAKAGAEQTITGNLSKQILEDFRKKFRVGMDWDEYSL